MLVHQSTDTVHWLHERGVRFMPNYGRQAFKLDGRFKFFGGVVIYANGGGDGLMQAQYKAAEKHRHRGPLRRARDWRCCAGAIRRRGRARRGRRRARGAFVPRRVVLACGGFEANREWRARYLGPGWDMAKVRGTRYNTGDGIRMALDIGAQSYGQWSGCHSCRLGALRRRLRRRRDAPHRLSPQLSLRHHGQRRRQALSSTRAPISATTPTRNTAASSCSSPAATLGRCSMRRRSL